MYWIYLICISVKTLYKIFALAKAEKTILTQDINIKHINSLHVDLEGKVERQRDIIKTLSRKLDTLELQQKSTGNL